MYLQNIYGFGYSYATAWIHIYIFPENSVKKETLDDQRTNESKIFI